MAKEFRRITFTNAELRAAVAHHLKVSGPKVPAGDIVTIEPRRQGNGEHYALGFFEYAKQKSASFNVEPEPLQEAIIDFCIASAIPLPNAADKEVRTVDDNVCLDIFMR